MTGGSKLDEEVFKEFYEHKNKLRSIAGEIKKIAQNDEIKNKIYSIEDDEESKNDSVTEGQVLYKLHKVRERDFKIVNAKKDKVLNNFGKLACEACIFEFEEYYGEIGKGYIECHHRTPLSSSKLETKTTLDDLSLVCSNCHRMLHRSIDYLTVEDLKMRIKYYRY
jgi:5-methylcytosine-specific restriction enzyme A